MPSLGGTFLWLVVEDFHLQSSKCSCRAYELQLTTVPSPPHQTLILGEGSILCWGLFFLKSLPSELEPKEKKKANVVYRCYWLQFSANQSHCVLVSCSSSNPTANSLDSDSVCLESYLQLEFLDTQTDLFFFLGLWVLMETCHASLQQQQLAGCQIYYNPPHLRDDFSLHAAQPSTCVSTHKSP